MTGASRGRATPDGAGRRALSSSSPRPHALLALVKGALPSPRARSEGPLLASLERRLADLRDAAEGDRHPLRGGDRERVLWRRFLAPLEGTWHDGDENLVRGFTDPWVRKGADPRRAAARGLCDAADALARIAPRPETLWFFLWEVESVLAGLAPGEGPRARIRSVRKRTPWRS